MSDRPSSPAPLACSYPSCPGTRVSDELDRCCKAGCEGVVHFAPCQQALERQMDFSADGAVLCHSCLNEAAQVPRTAYEQGLELLQLRREVRYVSAQCAALLERTTSLEDLVRRQVILLEKLTGLPRPTSNLEAPLAAGSRPTSALANGEARKPAAASDKVPGNDGLSPETPDIAASGGEDKGGGSDGSVTDRDGTLGDKAAAPGDNAAVDTRKAALDGVATENPPTQTLPLPALAAPTPAYLASVIYADAGTTGAGAGPSTMGGRRTPSASRAQTEEIDDDIAVAASVLGGGLAHGLSFNGFHNFSMDGATPASSNGGSGGKRGLSKWVAAAKGPAGTSDPFAGTNGELPASKMPGNIVGIWEEYERELRPVIVRHGRNAWSFSRLGHYSKAAQNRWDKRRSAITVIETTAAAEGVSPLVIAQRLDDELIAMDMDPSIRPATLRAKQRIPLQVYIDTVLRPRARAVNAPQKRAAPALAEPARAKRHSPRERLPSPQVAAEPAADASLAGPTTNPALQTKTGMHSTPNPLLQTDPAMHSAPTPSLQTESGTHPEAPIKEEPEVVANGMHQPMDLDPGVGPAEVAKAGSKDILSQPVSAAPATEITV